MRHAAVLGMALLGISLFIGACSSGVEVATRYGTLSGERDGDVTQYLGIPFAQPPLGDLRWADPQPLEPWEGVLDATSKGNSCTQYGIGLPVLFPDEDCLTLNIWVPNTPGPHPVMFWVHGGAQMAGSSTEMQYDGAKLAAAQNVMVVSANYRLLVSGFFAIPALGSGPEIKGNQAIKDLIAALNWVHDEIALFGGDPGNVTVFGESAGSTNTCALLATPKTRTPNQLLHRAIMQSGACDTLGVMTLDEAQQEGLALLEELGCADAPEPLQCARDIPIATIKDLKEVNLLTSFGWRLDEWPFRIGLVIDDDLFPQNPLELLVDESRPQMPILLGTNKDEGSLFSGFLAHPDDAAGYRDFMESRYPGRGDALASLYPFADYPNAGQAHSEARGDLIMKCPTLNMAQLYGPHNPTWMYSFEHDVNSPVMSVLSLGFKSNAPELGTFHSADIGYLFEYSLLTLLNRASDKAVKDYFQQAWGNFARTGNPNGEGLVEWQAFDSARNNYLKLSESPENLDDFRQGACDYWFETGYGF